MPFGSITASRVLWSYLKSRRDSHPRVAELRPRMSPLGHPWVQYEPQRRKGRPVILVHGVTPRAAEDANLVHLARCIARLGHPCLTPPLDGLAHFRHTPSDVETLVEALQFSRDHFGEPASVLGFSYGASYALSAAAAVECHNACKGILVFGAYYQLEHALEHQRKRLIQNPDANKDDSDLLYLRYTLLACQREDLDLPPSAWDPIDATLANFMVDEPIEVKRRALVTHASHLDFVQLMEKYQQRTFSPLLSPARRVGDIQCPVALLHDPEDRFIPPNQVELLKGELDARPQFDRTASLITPLVSHVHVNPSRDLPDAVRFIRILGKLFE